MARLYIAEFSQIAPAAAPTGFGGNQGSAPIVGTPPLAEQVLSIGGGSVPSTAFGPATKMIRVHCDAICSIVFGKPTPVATADNMRLAANQTEYFGVSAGQMVAVIGNS